MKDRDDETGMRYKQIESLLVKLFDEKLEPINKQLGLINSEICTVENLVFEMKEAIDVIEKILQNKGY
jgi:hypothetical protein